MTELPPFKTWQFYAACKKLLGMAALQKIFKKSPTQIYRWARDPVCEDTEKNPLDRTAALLERLCEIGREDIARAAVNILAKTVGCELVCEKDAEPDQEDIRDEILDDLPEISNFHQAIRNQEDRDVVQYVRDRAMDEIRQTSTAYVRILEGRRKK